MKARDDSALARRLLKVLTSSWQSQAIYVAARLGLADVLAKGASTCEALAEATGSHAPTLRRLLGALTTLDLCAESDDGKFRVTRLGSLLATDAPYSMRASALLWGSEGWQIWSNLLYSVKTGCSARALVTGTPGFAHLEKDSVAAENFNQAMVERTRLIATEVVQNYDFSSKRIVDVGGGYGELLARILEAYTDSRGVLFDRPHAVENARSLFSARGLGERFECVAGDFFVSVPSGADLYLLKSIVHDWDDAQSITILENCRKAMRPGARLLLIERLMPERLQPTEEHQILAQCDLHMLVALGALERTQAAFVDLLKRSGLRWLRRIQLKAGFCIVEAVLLRRRPKAKRDAF